MTASTYFADKVLHGGPNEVANYLSVLRAYAEKTQFILITHRKGSMVVSDSLYGVTMEEKGVSRLISVQLVDEAV